MSKNFLNPRFFPLRRDNAMSLLHRMVEAVDRTASSEAEFPAYEMAGRKG